MANMSLANGRGEFWVGCGDPMIVIDVRGRVLFVNEAAERLTGIPRREAIGSSCWDVVDGVDAEGKRICSESCAILSRQRRAQAVPCVELLVRAPVGRRRAVLSTLSVVCKGEQALVHLIQASRPTFEPTAERVASDLTPRQREVLMLLAEGLSTRELAERLALSPDTVRNHVRRILGALGCHNRLEAVAVARRAGLL